MRTMQQADRRRGGFTLIELMVTIALIGILAAIAVPSFRTYQLRSKRSEAFVNLAGVRTAELAYFHEAGGYILDPGSPGPAFGPPGPDKKNWTAAGFSSAGPGAGFDLLGWRPEGPSYFIYDTDAVNIGPNGPYFTAAAYGDTDGDTNMSVFLYVHPDSAGASLPSMVLGMVAPFNPSTCAPLLDTVAQVPSVAGCGFPVADDY